MATGRGARTAAVVAWCLLHPATGFAQAVPGATADAESKPATSRPSQPATSPQETGAITPAPAPAPTFDLAKTLDAARATVRQFKDRLKSELATAIKSDGAANAISLCQTISPDISTELTDNSGFEVSRTSLRLRNPENAPSPWELAALRDFQEKAAAGAEPDKLEVWEETVSPEGDKLFRYMRGIQTGELCLSCHGSDLKPDVKAELTRYYPDDKATGYKLGELRGAFSLVKLIGE